MGFKDSWSTRKVYKDIDANTGRMADKTDEGRRPLAKFVPLPVYHPVTLNPTGEPSYVDGQVSDILAEIQEGDPLRPFVEGEAIGSLLKEVEASGALLFGIPLIEYNRMSARVWADHKRLTAKRRRQQYETVRRQSGRTFRFVWHADVEAFRVQDITTLAAKENLS